MADFKEANVENSCSFLFLQRISIYTPKHSSGKSIITVMKRAYRESNMVAMNNWKKWFCWFALGTSKQTHGTTREKMLQPTDPYVVSALMPTTWFFIKKRWKTRRVWSAFFLLPKQTITLKNERARSMKHLAKMLCPGNAIQLPLKLRSTGWLRTSKYSFA